MLRPAVVVPVLLASTILAGVAAYLFQPWKLWVDDVANECPPRQAAVLASGRLVSHEHATSGTVRVLRLPDGARVLRLDNLDTSTLG